jgi:hypothetical protein
MKQAEKLERETKLRDLALAIVKARGKMESIEYKSRGSSHPMLMFKGDGFSISHHTPFSRLPQAPDDMKYFAARHGKLIDLPYGLDIWLESGGSMSKVLNVEWDDANRRHFRWLGASGSPGSNVFTRRPSG